MTLFIERDFREVIKLKHEAILCSDDMETETKLSGEQRGQIGKWGGIEG